MQEISESFVVAQPAEQVWAIFQDIPRVVNCMPGLEYLGEPEPGTHSGRVRMKLGPINANFEGKATFTRIDPEARTAELEATGADKKAGSQARAGVSYSVEETGPAESRVTLTGNIKLTGALANLGRSSIVKDVARHLTDQFAQNLREMLAEEPAPAASDNAAPQPADDARPDNPGTAPPASSPPAPASQAPASPAQAISGFALFKVVVLGWFRRLGGAKS